MTAPALRPTGQDRVQVELLARLGLPASASPEDVDQLHQSVSEFLAAAPSDIRGWARAQVAALDSAYLQLTDPAGLEGSALKSLASPPRVVPGGPATPPARRDPVPAPVPVAAGDDDADDADAIETASLDDVAALYAMVTPSAHEDMKPKPVAARAAATAPKTSRRVVATRPARAASVARAAATQAPAPGDANVWKRLFLAVIGIAAAVALLFAANAVINGGAGAPAPTQAAQAGAGAPSVDLNKVGRLMAALEADPQDIETLLALGNEYYNGMEYETAASWFDKVLAIEPENLKAMLARGAVSFNSGDTATAEETWNAVLDLDPDNVEAHYDLGFLAFYQAEPDYDAVQDHWGRVVALDPDSDLGKQVQTHLDALVMKSMIPAPSGDPSASPDASGAASPAATGTASPAPSAAASPAASDAP